MKRYRLIASTDPPGGCSEFSAMSDELALDAARSMLYGSRIVSLVEVDLAAPSETRAVEVKS